MIKHDKKMNLLRGASLVEMVIIIIVMATLASFATIRFQGSLRHARLQHATDRLMADLALVRDRASLVQQSFTIELDAGNRTYQAPGVVSMDRPEDISINLQNDPYNVTSMSTDLPSNELTYLPDGTASDDGTITLRSGEENITIQVEKNGNISQQP